MSLTSSEGGVKIKPFTESQLAALRDAPSFVMSHADLVAHFLATIDALKEQLYRSATVCPKDGCMLWKRHKLPHMTSGEIESMRAEVLELRATPAVKIR